MSKKQKDAMNNPETVAAAPTDPPPAPPETDKPAAQIEAKPVVGGSGPKTQQRPSIGRIVHYTPPEATAIDKATKEGGGQPFPAIITHVNDDGTPNLHVFNDGEFGLRGTNTPTHVPEFDPHPEAKNDSPNGFWFWPPRV